MSRIAVAGATGSVGRTFIQELSKTKHTIFGLTRKEQESSSPNITYHIVDYISITSLQHFLETNNIDTVISAISMLSAENSQAQLNLIAAAEQSNTVKRFIPSEYGVPANAATAAIDPYAQYWVDNAIALSKTNLQYTRISVGTFFDWWGKPAGLRTEILDLPWVLDVKNGKAAIPGTGREKVSMTYSVDVARFVVRLLDEDRWDTEVGLVGEDVTFDEFVRTAERVTGSKFDVTYDGREVLERGDVTVLSEDEGERKKWKEVLNLFGKLCIEGLMSVPDTKGYRLNERFPDMKVLTAEEMIRQCWSSE